MFSNCGIALLPMSITRSLSYLGVEQLKSSGKQPTYIVLESFQFFDPVVAKVDLFQICQSLQVFNLR